MAFFDNVNMLGPIFTSLCSLCFALVILIFGKQPGPYMDEVFHIPQAQKYCEHRFNEWDPMITTLPGLYFSSWLFLEGLAVALKQDVKTLCMPLFLRITNVLFNMGNIWVIYRILRKLNEMKEGKEKTEKTPTASSSNDASLLESNRFFNSSTAVTLGIFPLLFFFMFLYYTDIGSTFSVLLMYYLSLNDRHLCAAVVGIYAIFFRQTNVVWVVFTAGVTAVRMLEPVAVAKLGQNSSRFLSLVTEFVRQVIANMKTVAGTLWPYALVLIFFGAFVFLNGGIAVGDKTHHQVCFNFPQIFYFACFTFFFSFSHLTSPNLVYNMFLFLMSVIRRRYHSFLIMILFTMYYLVQNFTYVHPYLLADNRHYTFYVWKNIYKAHPEVKVALIPIYVVACTAIFLSIDRSRLWKIVYAVCVSAVLIPQGLLEFRYFILPYLMFRIHIRRPESWKLASEFLIYAAVNFFTLWMFLNKTFKWPNSPDVQRFIW